MVVVVTLRAGQVVEILGAQMLQIHRDLYRQEEWAKVNNSQEHNKSAKNE